jgi:hypothetical protein
MRRRAIAAAGRGADKPGEAERCGAIPGGEPAGAPDPELDASEPGEPRGGQDRGDEEVQAQPEDVVRRVDAQQLLEDAERRVPGDVEGEEPGRADLAVAAKPDECSGERQVPEQLVEERRVEAYYV